MISYYSIKKKVGCKVSVRYSNKHEKMFKINIHPITDALKLPLILCYVNI